MKPLATYIKETSMYYRHILTYNFSEDDTRASFMELVEGLGYMEAEDQSTYVLPLGEALTLVNATKAIEDWSAQRDVKISKEDFVQLFYLAPVQINDKKVTMMASKFMKYNPTTKGLK
jgi:hypothetical protein